MSLVAYDRQIQRESLTWKPFAFSFPFNNNQTTNRIIVYGLYSDSYMNQQGYLVAIEAVELTNLLNDYNIKIAALTTDQQVVVADIVSKRYLAGIDKLIHDQKMVTKQSEIDAENLTWDAKIAALAADQAALLTLDAKVQTEILKTNAKIAELQANIEIEAYRLSEVDMEIAEKEIQAAKVDLQKLETANAVLKIQIEIVNTAVQLVEVDLQIARTKVDISNVDREIAKIGFRAIDLLIEKARTLIVEAEEPIAAAKVVLAQVKTGEVQTEVDFTNVILEAQAVTSMNSKIDLLDVKQEIKENELTKNLQEKELNITNKRNLSAQAVSFANADYVEQKAIDAVRLSELAYQVVDKTTLVNAAIAVAATMASANIVTTLTHTISKAGGTTL
jgi:hypothetical protein